MRGSLVLLLAISVPLGGCGGDADDVTRAGVPGALTDRQVMGVVAELALAEIDGARVALRHAVTAPVQALAARFKAEDEAAFPALLGATTVTPGGSDVTDRLIHEQIAANDQVLRQQGLGVDVAYLCEQLLGQLEALQIIDGQLLASVTDPSVLAVVATVRGVTVLHQQETQLAARPFHLRYGIAAGTGPYCAPSVPTVARYAPPTMPVLRHKLIRR